MDLDSQWFDHNYYFSYSDGRVDWLRNEIWNHCKSKLTMLITEKEIWSLCKKSFEYGGRDYSSVSNQLESITVRHRLESDLKVLQLNGDLVPLTTYTDASVNAEGNRSESWWKRREARQEAKEAARQAATELSEDSDGVVSKMNGTLRERMGQPGVVFVAEFTLWSISEDIERILRNESAVSLSECRVTYNKCLIPREVLKYIYNTAIRDSFTRARVHLCLASQGLIQSLPRPGHPNVIRVDSYGGGLDPLVPSDLHIFALVREIVYIRIEMAKRNIITHHSILTRETEYHNRIDTSRRTFLVRRRMLPHSSILEASARYDDPEESARARGLTDEDLTAREKEVKQEMSNLRYRYEPYPAYTHQVDIDVLDDLFIDHFRIHVNLNNIQSMFSTQSPYSQQLSNFYQLVQSVHCGRYDKSDWFTEDVQRLIDVSSKIQPNAGNDPTNLNYTYKVVNKLMETIGYSYVPSCNASNEDLADFIKDYGNIRLNPGIANLAVGIQSLAVELSKTYPALPDLKFQSNLALASPGLGDLPPAMEVQVKCGIKCTCHEGNGSNPVNYIYPDLAERSLVFYILANLALAHPHLVYMPLANLGLVTPGLANFLLANPQLAHPSMARLVESYPNLINMSLAMHIISNLIMTYPSLPDCYPKESESVMDEAIHPDIMNPDLISPRNPEISNPERASPGLDNPLQVNPDPIIPELENPALGNFDLRAVSLELAHIDLTDPPLSAPVNQGENSIQLSREGNGQRDQAQVSAPDMEA